MTTRKHKVKIESRALRDEPEGEIRNPPRKFLKLKWYLYTIFTFLLWGFIDPALISAKDDLSVIGGVALAVVWVEISYYFWVKPLINKLKENVS
jgi:hypothetical protein